MGCKNKIPASRLRFRRSCLALIPTLGLGLLGGSWLITYIMLHPATQTTGSTPASAPALAFREVSFTTSDNVTLRGWFLPGQHHATVIMVHGFARDRTELLPEARWLVEQGYSVLLFDLRAQGKSDGNHISFGYLETLDVRAAVGFVLSQSPQERIGALGYSMGAVAAIQAAAEEERVQAVIAVSPFATLGSVVDHRFKRIPLAVHLATWWGERMTGLHLDDLRPVDHVVELSPRPILIMQAGADKLLPEDSGQRLYEAAGEPKQLWVVPGVDHVDFRQAVPQAYKEHIISFFTRYLPLG